VKNANRSAPGLNSQRTLTFTFDGVTYQGHPGDTLASALLANGVFVVGRSFKLHRPRGVLAAGADEPNAIIQLEPNSELSEPDLKATQVELYDGLNASSVNRWPNLKFDVGAALGVFKPFLPAGFYYKTFMWPNWHTFEPAIRKAAGLGVAPTTSDPDKYDSTHIKADVLIVGAGPAGLAAAYALCASGISVVLADENEQVGLSFKWAGANADGHRSLEWADRVASELDASKKIRILRRTTATGYYDHNTVTLVEKVSEHIPTHARSGLPKQRLWMVRAKHVIIAAGSHERPIVFQNNDRPGIMLANAAATYSFYYGVKLARTAVGFVNNDRAYQALFTANDSGTTVSHVIDSRTNVNASLVDGCQRRGISLLKGATVTNAIGRSRISRVQVRGTDGRTNSIRCDLLLVSGGWSPAVHLYSQAQGKIRYDDRYAMFRPAQSPTDLHCIVIGGANGTFGFKASLEEARAAALRVANALGVRIATANLDPISGDFVDAEYAIEPLWKVKGSKAPGWVDFQNDVTEADVRLAAKENFISVEHLKRYTTMGMASDQGKSSNVNALALLGAETGRAPGQVGTTKFRPPYSPVTMGTFAGHARGDLFRPRRYLPAHKRHLAYRAHLIEYGAWMRPAFYRVGEETEQEAWYREVIHVRSKVGVFDGSPLGKIEVKGPDASRLLNAVFANELGNLGIGKCRYSVILNEGGGILDDGVISRIAEDHFLVGASSAGTQHVLEALEYWRESGDGYRVAIMQASSEWATFAVTGPDSRKLMQALPFDVDLSKESFPHMSFKQGTLGGVPCRIARVSFSGEVTFELSVPAHFAEDVFEAIVQAGAMPFGVEALMIMRTEKGFIHVGADTEPATTLADVGMGSFGAKKTSPFVGQRAAQRSALTSSSRMQLVGIQTINPAERLRAGGHLVTGRGSGSEGFLSSCVWSPVLKRHIALALVKSGSTRHNQDIKVYDDGKYIDSRIVAPCFVDPEGVRLKL
jgi:sarcosine oxidase, subunit alpha